jgi:hypothetical protein
MAATGVVPAGGGDTLTSAVAGSIVTVVVLVGTGSGSENTPVTLRAATVRSDPISPPKMAARIVLPVPELSARR